MDAYSFFISFSSLFFIPLLSSHRNLYHFRSVKNPHRNNTVADSATDNHGKITGGIFAACILWKKTCPGATKPSLTKGKRNCPPWACPANNKSMSYSSYCFFFSFHFFLLRIYQPPLFPNGVRHFHYKHTILQRHGHTLGLSRPDSLYTF